MQKTDRVDPDLEQINRNLRHSFRIMDHEGIVGSLQDLVDFGLSCIMLYSRTISTTGDRIKWKLSYPGNRLTIESVNGIANHVLCAKYYDLFSRISDENECFKHLKHMNDMDPDEYKWCFVD